jgi:hypothetical protein
VINQAELLDAERVTGGEAEEHDDDGEQLPPGGSLVVTCLALAVAD